MFSHSHCIRFEVFKLHLYQVSFRNTCLVRFVLMIQFGINGQNILFKLLITDILQLQRLNGISKETTCTFENSIRITHQIDKLSIGEHLDKLFHTSRMRRILTKKLSSLRIPKRDFYQFDESLLKHFQFFLCNIIKQQIFIGILLLIFGQEPEIIIGVGHHICQSKLLFLRKVDGKLHIVRGAFVRHQPAHVLLKERLPPHHEMRKYSLVCRVVTEMLVAGENIMHKRSPATPMSQNEYRIMLQGLICQELFITSVLQRSQSGQQAADSFCQPILAFVGSTDVTTARYILECFPICAYQCVYRKLVEF